MTAPSGEELSNLARAAERSLLYELKLILSGGFAALMLVLFPFGAFTFLPLAERLGQSPTLTWVFLGAVLSGLWAILHSYIAPPAIARAKEQYAQAMKEYDEIRQAEVAQKIKDMKEEQ